MKKVRSTLGWSSACTRLAKGCVICCKKVRSIPPAEVLGFRVYGLGLAAVIASKYGVKRALIYLKWSFVVPITGRWIDPTRKVVVHDLGFRGKMTGGSRSYCLYSCEYYSIPLLSTETAIPYIVSDSYTRAPVFQVLEFRVFLLFRALVLRTINFLLNGLQGGRVKDFWDQIP